MSKLIQCKSCGKDIAKSAASCPNCGAKNKGSGVVKWILIAVGVLLVIGVMSSGNNNQGTTGTTRSASSQPEIEIIRPGYAVTWRNLELGISAVDVQRSISDGSFFSAEAQPGAVLVIAQIVYKNVGTEPLSPFEFPDLVLISPEGTEYEEDLGKSSSAAAIYDIDQKAWSDLNPGLRSQSVSVFEVSEASWESGEWHFEFEGIANLHISTQ